MKRILISLCVLLSFAGCKENEKDGHSFILEHYIGVYIVPDEIHVSESSAYFMVSLTGETIADGKAGQDDKHELYAQRYGDTDYNRYYGAGPYAAAALAEPLSLLEVVVLNDYDIKHLAGDNICDIIRAECVTYYDYVSNQYKGDEERTITAQYGSESTQNILLAKNCFLCTFISPPAVGGEYDFEIKVKVGEKVLSTIATLTWD